VSAKGAPVPIPLALGDTGLARLLLRLNQLLIRLWPQLFAFQSFMIVRPLPSLPYLLQRAHATSRDSRRQRRRRVALSRSSAPTRPPARTIAVTSGNPATKVHAVARRRGAGAAGRRSTARRRAAAAGNSGLDAFDHAGADGGPDQVLGREDQRRRDQEDEHQQETRAGAGRQPVRSDRRSAPPPGPSPAAA